MTPSKHHDELLELLNRLTAGTIASAEQARLEAILNEDPQARQMYFAFMDLDQGLRDLSVAEAAQMRSATNPPRPSRTAGIAWLGYATTAAVAIAATWLAMSMLAQPEPSGAENRTLARSGPLAEDVATLLFAEQCHWKTGGLVPIEGQPLNRGELHLLEGLALLRFHGGAIALISGEVRVDLESRGSMRLHHGRLGARAPEEAVGFTVRTPVSDVVDLGTEFAVEVDRSGKTKLDVIEGEVEYRKPAGQPGSGKLLTGGQAVRFQGENVDSVTPIKANAKSIEQLLREANPRAREDLMFVYEGFQYDPGSLALSAASGGWGWNGPWREHRLPKQPPGVGQSAAMQIGFQQLSIPWPIRGGRAGMLEIPPGRRAFVRPLAQPISLRRDAVYYISMMMRESAHKANDGNRPLREIASLSLRGSGSYWSDRVGLGLHSGHSPHIEISDFNRFVGPRIARSQSMIWAAKIVARKHAEDQIFFRVYQEGDSLDIVEPADWSVISRNLRSDALLDRLQVSSEGNTTRWFDEIRIGTSWRAVIPISKATEIHDASQKTDRQLREWETAEPR